MVLSAMSLGSKPSYGAAATLVASLVALLVSILFVRPTPPHRAPVTVDTRATPPSEVITKCKKAETVRRPKHGELEFTL